MFKTLSFVALSLGLSGRALAGPPLTAEEALALMARPGSWIEADGAMQRDGSLLAKDVEVYTAADSAELEEPAIYGAATAVHPDKGSMRVLGYTVGWDTKTTIKDEKKLAVQAASIGEGRGIKVQGNLQGSGVFKASKIKLQEMKGAKVKEKIFGPVTVVDARKRELRVLNTRVVLRPDATLVRATGAP